MVGFVLKSVGGDSHVKPDVPLWLEELLRSKFFEPCHRHDDGKKNDINIFCMDCNYSICQQCFGSSHMVHNIIQVRRYVYHDVVLLHDMQKLIDCCGVQSYKINRAKAVFLNPRPQFKATVAPVKPASAVCESCNRILTSESSQYCSIACKVVDGAQLMKSQTLGLSGLPEVINMTGASDSTPPSSPSSSYCNSSEEGDTWMNSLRPRRHLNKRKGIPRRAPVS